MEPHAILICLAPKVPLPRLGFFFFMFPRAKRPDRAHHDWLSLAVPVGAVHLLVPGLQPHTQYQFSVLAQNKLGSGPFSEIVLSAPEGECPLSPGLQRPGQGRTGRDAGGRAVEGGGSG